MNIFAPTNEHLFLVVQAQGLHHDENLHDFGGLLIGWQAQGGPRREG
jgi:hypothetical protein